MSSLKRQPEKVKEIIEYLNKLDVNSEYTTNNVSKMSDYPNHRIKLEGGDFFESEISPTLKLLIELDKSKDLKNIKKDLDSKNKLKPSEYVLRKKIEEYQKTKGNKDSILKLDRRWKKSKDKYLFLAGKALKDKIKKNRRTLKITPKIASLLSLDRDRRVLIKNKVDVTFEINKMIKILMDSKIIDSMIKKGILPKRYSPNKEQLRSVTNSIFKAIRKNPQFVDSVFSHANNKKIGNIIKSNRKFLNNFIMDNRRKFKKIVEKQLKDSMKIRLENKELIKPPVPSYYLDQEKIKRSKKRKLKRF